MSYFLLAVAVLIILFVLFLRLPASAMASILRKGIPALLILAGVGLSLLGRAGIGSMVLFVGIALWRRFGAVPSGFSSQADNTGKPQVSTVRSAALEMELNHETGDMNGLVLAGRFENCELERLGLEELTIFYDEIRADGESIALLDAYLDRRFSGWREYTHFDAGAGQRSPTTAGAMGEQEAYKVLGLSPGAGSDEVRKAHRRLMKAAHPDSGGSTFLAAKINEAKDVLLKSHS